MPFISYAQNFEDVMLWRALSHIEKGFYVDVGAMDPIIDSVTQAFYERGWRGINIEPARLYYENLSRARPLDINLLLAVSNIEDVVKFYEIPETGLSTLDPDIARIHQGAGWTVIEKQVSVLPLNQILAEHAKDPIHFMKIDVEGGEVAVLEGLDLARWRPWIIVMESTKPNSSELNCEAWEDLILTAGYNMVYFDGLNQFYLAREHNDLKEKFRLPPNVFDNFIVDDLYFVIADRDALRADRDALRADRDALRADRDALRADWNRIQTERDSIQRERDSIMMQLHDMQVTLSWRLTRPLRQVKEVSRDTRHIYETKIKSGLIMPVIRRLASMISKRPRLKHIIFVMIHPFPNIEKQVRMMVEASRSTPRAVKLDLNNLSQRAQTIYYDLLSVIQERNLGE